MSVMFCLSTLFYWIGFAGRSEAWSSLGTKLSWAAVVLCWAA